MLHRLHLKHCIVRSELRSVKGGPEQILFLQLISSKWRNPTKWFHEYVYISWVANHGCGLIWWFPVILLSTYETRLWMLLCLHNHFKVIWWWRTFTVRRKRFRVWNIDSSDIMDARSSLILPSCMLPDKVLLSMTSNLSRSPSGHIITSNISPITFTILLKTHEKLPVVRINTKLKKKKKKTALKNWKLARWIEKWSQIKQFF